MMFALQIDGEYVRSGTRVNTGGWMHVAAALPPDADNAQDAMLYVNGVLQTHASTGARQAGAAEPVGFRIGTDNDAGHVAGLIDGVRIYERTLEPHEIAETMD